MVWPLLANKALHQLYQTIGIAYFIIIPGNNFKEIFRKEEIVIVKDQNFDNHQGGIDPPEERYVKIGRFEGAEKSQLERVFDVS